MKKTHWTQTPEGRKHMAALSREGWKKRPSRATPRPKPAPTRTKTDNAKNTKRSKASRRAGRNHLAEVRATENGAFSPEDFAAAILFGYTTHAVEEHARRAGVPPGVLAARLGHLLLGTTGG